METSIPLERKSLFLACGGELPLFIQLVLRLIKPFCQTELNLEENYSSSTDVELRLEPESQVVNGVQNVARCLARLFPESNLYGRNKEELSYFGTKVDEWIDRIASQEYAGDKSEKALSALCSYVNEELFLRTFLVGYHISLADLAVWSRFKGDPLFSRFLELNRKKLPYLFRWFSYIASVPEIQPFVISSSSTTLTNASRTGSQGSFSNLALPNAERGKVITRFPPEPSGYLHLGHAKAALLNSYYATFYEGRLIVRFDDTNPSKEKIEYIDSILSDLETIGIKPQVVTYTSDYFDQLLEFAERLIKEGKGYVDDTPPTQMKEERMNGISSQRRNDSIEENLRRWNEMKQGTSYGKQCVLRGKIDMSCKNKAMRDPSLYRCKDEPHHRTGSKYHVYPLYDFAIPIVDSIEGVTHAMRTSEYHDRNALYYWVVDSLHLRRPFIEDFSRLNFSYTLLSKRKLQWFVDHGIVSGWNDPRFPTIQGLLRRGLTVEALKEFVLSQGASKTLNLMDIEKLWAVNKKVIDPVVPRYTAIAKNGKCLLTLDNGPTAVENKSLARHKKNPSLGNKIISFFYRVWIEREDAISISPGEEVTLMDWGNAVIHSLIKNENGELTGLNGSLHLEGSVKATDRKLTWLPTIDDIVPVSLVHYGFLITKRKLEENDKLEDFVNYDSKKEIEAIGDPNLRLLKRGERIQLERRGYYICDSPFLNASNPMVLIEIPDGHTSKVQSVLTTKPVQNLSIHKK